MKRALRLTCAVAACGLSACAARAHAPRVGAGAPVAETRDEILLATGDAVWRGDLATAHAVLTRLADRERGAADPALDFWSELLALLRCDPIGRAPRTDGDVDGGRDPWNGLRRLVQIERVRLSRRSEGDLPAAGATRPAAGATERGQLVWPVERERWNDELPLPAIVDRCLAPDWPAHATTKANAKTASHAPTANEAALVEGVANGFAPEHPAKPILLVQAAALDIARGRGAAAMSPLARLADLAQDVLTAAERRQAILASALAAIADPAAAPDQLLARGRAGLAADLDAVDRRALALALGERLLRDGRTDDAAALLGPPPHGDDEVGRFIAFRQIEAHARAGRRAELLAEAREALQQRSREEVDDDDALSAILDVALRTLLASPISAETLEVLETLGPPRERQARAETFARLALEAGVHRSAMATFLWLHDNEPDPNRRLQHLARASVAAARAGDRAEFARTFKLLAGQEEPEPGAAAAAKPNDKKGARTDKADATVGKHGERPRSPAAGMVASPEGDRRHERQRASRSANWQRALLVVARDALPALVEGDDQANLDILVATLKRHLGDGGRGPVDEELTTLYRAASAHLKSGARAYAQNVGSPRRPILLGDVLVGRHPDVTAPELDLRAIVGEVGPLVFVPRRGNDPSLGSLARWPGGFGTTWTGSGSL